ncbi:PEP-CTERM sorting domain-containing protein [Roseateles oligotrophus]|uniref:PEP-CTERM sorting domain-containing protein n=1 Tax=Roseateles oligotrophus TaxID=1769250 RepID=A0ABT2YDH9_9BURK|nr:PEP-CTERM sorting domain-containing protein [Roseateles oligotrophus]MCV2368108.1 PEP-CTERM sorting domain-containing protein [Roseateles oligotrophus]
MRPSSKSLAICLLALALGAPAHAVGVRVEVVGSVEYSVIQGGLSGVKAGDRAVMSFNLDSDNYLNSENFPTRGYRIDLGSFDLSIGGVHMQLDMPQAGSGDALFVLRDNDPEVDGFFLSLGPDDRVPLSLHVPGLEPEHELEFGRTFSVNTALHSLNILDAVGVYGFENMSSYQWTMGRFGNYGLEVGYEGISISAVPEPTTQALFGLGALALLGIARWSRQGSLAGSMALAPSVPEYQR